MKPIMIALALLATSALAQTPAPSQVGAAAASQHKVTPATQNFVSKAAMTDLFEIEAGKLAQQRSTNDDYKTFAQMTIDDHTNTTTQLKTMQASIRGLQLPSELDSAHKQKLQKLQALAEAPFERQYKAEQVQGHEQAIRLFETYAKSGDNTELKKWAEDTLPTLKTHLQHAQALPKPGAAATTGSGHPQSK
jgi:putative membrane protein